MKITDTPNYKLTTSQAADLLGIQEQSVRIAIRRGALAATYDPVARRYWIEREEVEKYRDCQAQIPK